MDYSLPGSSVHGIFLARILEWVAISFSKTLSPGIPQARILGWVSFSFSRGYSQPKDWTQVSQVAGRFFTSWATREVQEYWSGYPIASPGDLPDPGIRPGSPALQVDSLPAELTGKPVMEILSFWVVLMVKVFFDMCDILWFKGDFHHVEEPSRFHGWLIRDGCGCHFGIHLDSDVVVIPIEVMWELITW